MFKLEFTNTVHNSIRVWMYFKPEDWQEVQKSKEYQLFQLLSIWGGIDKRQDDLYSWELPISLMKYIREKFAYYSNCEMVLMG